MFYKKDYNSAIKKKRTDEFVRNRAFHEFIIFNTIKDHVEDAKDDSFDLLELEKIYIKEFAERGVFISSHITRFVSKIETANIGLTIVQNRQDGKYRALKTNRIESVMTVTEWGQPLRKVIGPIRDEITEIQKMEKPDMSDLCTNPPPLPYKKLSVLMTYLCHGSPKFEQISLPKDTFIKR